MVDTRSPSPELERRRRHRVIRVAVYLELIGAISHLRLSPPGIGLVLLGTSSAGQPAPRPTRTGRRRALSSPRRAAAGSWWVRTHQPPCEFQMYSPLNDTASPTCSALTRGATSTLCEMSRVWPESNSMMNL